MVIRFLPGRTSGCSERRNTVHSSHWTPVIPASWPYAREVESHAMCTPPLPWIVTGAVRPTRLWCLSRIPVDELFVTEAVGLRTMPLCASPKDTRSDVGW